MSLLLSAPSQTSIQLTCSAPSLEVESLALEVVGEAMGVELTSVLEDQECISNFDINFSLSLSVLYTNLFHCAYDNIPSHSSVMLLSMPQKLFIILCNVCIKYTNIAIIATIAFSQLHTKKFTLKIAHSVSLILVKKILLYFLLR